MAAAARRSSAAALARLLPAARPCAAWVHAPARAMSAAAAAPAGAAHPPARAAAIASLRAANAVCFDVDSTVITVEAIDEFAAFAGKKAEVAELTAKAMGGSVLFQDALAARLSLINPTSDLLARFLREHPFEFTPGVRDVIGHLQRRGTSVYLVSGGFTQMINPVADVLGIPRAHVFANTILFAGDGSYAGFDKDAPTSRDGGKPEVVRRLKAGKGYDRVVMVGDGATDMQARPPADAFIGYGGVAVRPAVAAGADWFVRSFDEVLEELARQG